MNTYMAFSWLIYSYGANDRSTQLQSCVCVLQLTLLQALLSHTAARRHEVCKCRSGKWGVLSNAVSRLCADMALSHFCLVSSSRECDGKLGCAALCSSAFVTVGCSCLTQATPVPSGGVCSREYVYILARLTCILSLSSITKGV